MPDFFVSACWFNEGETPRSDSKRDRRITMTVRADTAADAVAFIRDWVKSRPNKPGRRRRITFAGASPLEDEKTLPLV